MNQVLRAKFYQVLFVVAIAAVTLLAGSPVSLASTAPADAVDGTGGTTMVIGFDDCADPCCAACYNCRFNNQDCEICNANC
jgi:hypothetical protein